MPEYRVRWTETARRDLSEIVEYIAADNPSAALAVLEKIQQRAERLVHQPARGRIVPELRHIEVFHYRELIETPWRIVYRIGHTQVLVLGVLDGRRDLETVLLERLTRTSE